MGQIMRLTDDDKHVSTGKWPYVAGEVHEPQWGEWFRDAPMERRYCEFPNCDVEDVR